MVPLISIANIHMMKEADPEGLATWFQVYLLSRKVALAPMMLRRVWVATTSFMILRTRFFYISHLKSCLVEVVALHTQADAFQKMQSLLGRLLPLTGSRLTTTGFADVKQPKECTRGIMSNWCNEMISIQISIRSTVTEVNSKWRSKVIHWEE